MRSDEDIFQEFGFAVEILSAPDPKGLRLASIEGYLGAELASREATKSAHEAQMAFARLGGMT